MFFSIKMIKRIGHKMKQVLEVLEKAEEPLTITELIMRIEHLTPVKDIFIQNELASALIHQSIGGKWAMTPVWIVKRKGGKQYHPMEYADLLYAKYSRAIRRLKVYGLVVDCGFRFNKKKGYRHTRTLKLTSRTDLKSNSPVANEIIGLYGCKPYGN